MHGFFLLAGIVLGLVFSVTLVSGTVWCVQLTLSRGMVTALLAAVAIALAQGLWAAVAAAMVFPFAIYTWTIDSALRLLAAATLTYMAVAVFRAPRVQSLHYGGELRTPGAVFRSTLFLALGMPLRLLAYLSLITAVSLHLRDHGLVNAPLFGFGVLLGSLAWWLYFILLASAFGKRVSEEVSLKSLNKLNRLAAIVFIGLTFIAITPLVPGFR